MLKKSPCSPPSKRSNEAQVNDVTRRVGVGVTVGVNASVTRNVCQALSGTLSASPTSVWIKTLSSIVGACGPA